MALTRIPAQMMEEEIQETTGIAYERDRGTEKRRGRGDIQGAEALSGRKAAMEEGTEIETERRVRILNEIGQED